MRAPSATALPCAIVTLAAPAGDAALDAELEIEFRSLFRMRVTSIYSFNETHATAYRSAADLDEDGNVTQTEAAALETQAAESTGSGLNRDSFELDGAHPSRENVRSFELNGLAGALTSTGRVTLVLHVDYEFSEAQGCVHRFALMRTDGGVASAAPPERFTLVVEVPPEHRITNHVPLGALHVSTNGRIVAGDWTGNEFAQAQDDEEAWIEFESTLPKPPESAGPGVAALLLGIVVVAWKRCRGSARSHGDQKGL